MTAWRRKSSYFPKHAMNIFKKTAPVVLAVILGFYLGQILGSRGEYSPPTDEVNPAASQKHTGNAPKPPAVAAQAVPPEAPALPEVFLLPPDMNERQASLALAEVTKHFLEQAAKNPKAFAALLKEKAHTLPPSVLEAGVWALAPHDVEGAVDAAASVKQFNQREQLSSIIAAHLPSDDEIAAEKTATKLKLNAYCRGEFFGALACRRAADNPAWAMETLKASADGGKTDRFLLRGIAQHGLAYLHDALKQFPPGRFSLESIKSAVVDEVGKDIGGNIAKISDLPGAAGIVGGLLDGLPVDVVSDEDVRALKEAVRQHDNPVDSSPMIVNKNASSLIEVLLAKGEMTPALEMLDGMKPSWDKDRIEVSAALAAGGGNWEKACQWIAQRNGGMSAQGGAGLRSVINQWMTASPDSMDAYIRKNPQGQGSMQMFRELNQYYRFRMNSDAYTKWKTTLPHSLSEQLSRQP